MLRGAKGAQRANCYNGWNNTVFIRGVCALKKKKERKRGSERVRDTKIKDTIIDLPIDV